MEEKKYIEAYFYSKTKIKSVCKPDISSYSEMETKDLDCNDSYHNLSDRYGIKYFTKSEDAFNSANSGRTLVEGSLPNYIYKIKLKNNNTIKDLNEFIMSDDLKKLNVLLSKEHKTVSYMHEIEFNSRKLSEIIDSLKEVLGLNRTYRILEKLSIYGLKSDNGITIISDKINYDINYDFKFQTKDNFKENLKKDIEIASNLKKIMGNSVDKILNNLFDKKYLTLIESALDNDEVFKILHSSINDGFQVNYSKKELKSILKKFKHDKFEKFIKENPKIKGILSRLTKVIFNNDKENTVTLPKNLKELEEFKNILSLGGVNRVTKKIFNEGSDYSFVLKELSNQKATEAEFESYKIYEAFGVDVPETNLIKEDNRTLLLMEFVDGKVLKEFDMRFNKIENNIYELDFIRKKVVSNFVIDAIVGNYDAGSVHLKNLIYLPNEKTVKRIDLGASLNYRHDGDLKNKKSSDYYEYIEWSPESILNEFSFLREGTFRSIQIANANYSDINNQEILDDLYSAELCLPKVKKVASEENYKIIEQRISIAINHFENLVSLEKNINNEENVESSFFDYKDNNLGFSDIAMGIKKQKLEI